MKPIELEIIMRDSTRQGMQSVTGNMSVLEKCILNNTLMLRQLEKALKDMQTQFAGSTKTVANQSENIAMMEALKKEVDELKAKLIELEKVKKMPPKNIPIELMPEINTPQFYKQVQLMVKQLEGDIAKAQVKASITIDGAVQQNEIAKIKTMSEELEKMNGILQKMEIQKKNTNEVPVVAPNAGKAAAMQFNGLGMSIQQVARELPSLTMGANMFFLAISNNLPILADNLKMARTEYAALTAQGQKATPVWKQVVSSIFSWQTAMVVGITLLTVYGKEIGNWVKGLFKGKDAIDATKISMDVLSKSLESYKKNLASSYSEYGKQVAIVTRLSSEWSKLGKNLSDKKKFVDQNKSSFSELGIEVNSVKDAENLLVGNTTNFVEAMKVRAQALAGQSTLQDLYAQQQQLNDEVEGGKKVAKARAKTITPDDIKKAKKINADNQRYAASDVGFIYTDDLVTPANVASEESEKMLKNVELNETKLKAVTGRIERMTKTSLKSFQDYKRLMNESDLKEDDKNKDKGTGKDVSLDDLSSADLKARQKIEAMKLAIMAEGAAKRKAAARNELDDELARIDKEERDRLAALAKVKKQGLPVSKEQVDTIALQSKQQKRLAMLKFADDTWQIEKDAIVKKQKLSDEERRSWIDYNKEYGTYQEKRLAISRDYVEKLSSAKTGGEKAALKKEKESRLKELDFNQFKDSIDFSKVFGDLDGLSTQALAKIRAKLEEYINKAGKDLSPENLKELQDAFKNIDFKMTDRNPFGELNSSLKEYKSACKSMDKAQEDLNTIQAGGEVIIGLYTDANGKALQKVLTLEQAERNLSTAQGNRQETLSKLTKSANDIGSKGREVVNAGQDVVGMLENFGVKVPEAISGALNGLGQVMDGLASMDITKPFTVITGAVSILSGIGNTIASIFGGGKETVAQSVIDGYKDLMSIYDDVIAKQKEMLEGISGSKALAQVKEAMKTVENAIQSTKNMYEQYGSAGSSAGSHSYAYRTGKNLSGNANKLNTLLGGSYFSANKDTDAYFKNANALMNLTAEQLKMIKANYADVWLGINGDMRDCLETLTEMEDEAAQLKEALAEALTGLTFDQARESLKSLLMDADTTMADVANSFEEYMRQAIVNTIIDDTLYTQIKAWYDKFAEAMGEKKERKPGGLFGRPKWEVVEEAGVLNEQEKKELQELYNKIYTDGKELRDKAYEAAGISPDDLTKQAGRAGTFTTMTQDQGTKLEGLFTSLQDHASSIDDTVMDISKVMYEVFDILSEIVKNTAYCKHLEQMAEDIAELKRDGVKLK